MLCSANIVICLRFNKLKKEHAERRGIVDQYCSATVAGFAVIWDWPRAPRHITNGSPLKVNEPADVYLHPAAQKPRTGVV
jgi:hypothetical protein